MCVSGTCVGGSTLKKGNHQQCSDGLGDEPKVREATRRSPQNPDEAWHVWAGKDVIHDMALRLFDSIWRVRVFSSGDLMVITFIQKATLEEKQIGEADNEACPRLTALEGNVQNGGGSPLAAVWDVCLGSDGHGECGKSHTGGRRTGCRAAASGAPWSEGPGGQSKDGEPVTRFLCSRDVNENVYI